MIYFWELVPPPGHLGDIPAGQAPAERGHTLIGGSDRFSQNKCKIGEFKYIKIK